MKKKQKIDPEDMVVFLISIIITFSITIPNELNGFVMMIIFFVIFCILIEIASSIKKSYNDKNGLENVNAAYKEEKLNSSKNRYEYELKNSIQNASEKYAIDYDAIRQFTNLTKQLVNGNIKRGLEMQNEKGPQQDWAIAGGMASGLAGGAVGTAVAIDTMKRNQEATERHHELGRKMVENGLKSLENIEKNQRELESIKFDDFEVTNPNEKLIDYLSIKCLDIKNYGIGYLDLSVEFSLKETVLFPNSDRKAAIDGSVLIELYSADGKELIAFGYYNAFGRYGNEIRGFGHEKSSKDVVLKIKDGVKFNKNNGYSLKLSEPNLWLVKTYKKAKK